MRIEVGRAGRLVPGSAARVVKRKGFHFTAACMNRVAKDLEHRPPRNRTWDE